MYLTIILVNKPTKISGQTPSCSNKYAKLTIIINKSNDRKPNVTCVIRKLRNMGKRA